MNALVCCFIFLYDVCSVVCAAIIDDPEFSVAVGLRQDAVNASIHPFFNVVGAYYNTYLHILF